ncbi:hypothetical protein [Neisseria bergeri]|uniref:hypothetical protein n=1 Tax=Neisseria bergeri TaxID=1906581 RepID=UPI0027E0DA1F|nr:hypothetical protein [Neisseria bergeri]
MYDCTGLYVPFTTIFTNKRKGRPSDGIKLLPLSFPPVLPPAGIIRIVQKMPYNRRTPCRCLRAVGQTKYLPETLFFLKHHDLHEKCRLKNLSDGISSLRQ